MLPLQMNLLQELLYLLISLLLLLPPYYLLLHLFYFLSLFQELQTCFYLSFLGAYHIHQQFLHLSCLITYQPFHFPWLQNPIILPLHFPFPFKAPPILIFYIITCNYPASFFDCFFVYCLYKVFYLLIIRSIIKIINKIIITN